MSHLCVIERCNPSDCSGSGCSDFDDVFDVERQSSARPYSQKVMQGIFDSATVFKAVVSGKTVGYVATEVVFETAEIINIAVLSDFRGQGIGIMLLAAATTESKAKGAMRLLLEVEETNLAAIGLYKKAGFRQISVRQNYYGSATACIMELSLKP